MVIVPFCDESLPSISLALLASPLDSAAVAPLVAANALLFSLPAFFVLVMGSGVVLAGADHACAIGDDPDHRSCYVALRAT